jgi:ATP-dependent RNA helicase DDX42
MAGFKMSIARKGPSGASGGRQRQQDSCALFDAASVDSKSQNPKPAAPLITPPAAPLITPLVGSGDVDSLDAFMVEVKAEAAKPVTDDRFNKKAYAAWEELQDEDPVASYCEAYADHKKGKALGGEVTMWDANSDDGDAEVREGGDDEETGDRRAKPIEPLPRIDHSEIEYEPVQTNFYVEHAEIASLTSDQVTQLRCDFRISATGSNCPSPATSFAHFGLPKGLMEGIRQHGYVKPTPIQAQGIPVGLSGRDVVGIAETGSGKTVAYLMPLLVHCAAQPPLQKGEGPIGLVLCPTRELAIQIEKETFKFNKPLGLRSTTLAGGLSKFQQFKELKGGSEIIIATPGRMIDIVKMKGCNLRRCTFVVLDEADRMLQMGFEPQMRSILQNVRPSRQALLFSATFPPKIERISTDLTQNPIRIIIGTLGQAADLITQRAAVLPNEDDKWPWLSSRIDSFLARGQILIFCKSKQGAEELSTRFQDDLRKESFVLHGDVDQDTRNRVLDSFRQRKADVLIATDLAARGLDVATIRTVVSYDAARDIETHTHRVGRTGRAGTEGEAYTLLVNDVPHRRIAGFLVEQLESAEASVPEELLALAKMNPRFKALRSAATARTDKPSGSESSSLQRSRSRSRSPPLK